MDRQFDLIIIGSGPAGMAAAIYAGRAGLSCAMIEGEAPGGKLVKTYEIANYPGIKEINGAELAMQMYEHSTAYNCESLFDRVLKVEDGEMKKVICESGTTYLAKAVIVATGTKERLLNIPNEKELTGKGVSYCAVCDGAFYRNKTVTVIGGGNSALEEALYLTQFVSKLYIVIRRDVFRADSVVVDKVENNEKIEIIRKAVPVRINEKDGKVGSIVLRNVDTNEEYEVETSGIFPYIGADPCTEMLEGLDVLDAHGYLLVKDDMSTSVPGIYGAGDCCNKVLRQVVTAVNDGAIAAQSVFHYLHK